MVKTPENIVELLELEQRYNNAQFFLSQSDNESECERAEAFIIEAEEAFSKCKVKFKYD